MRLGPTAGVGRAENVEDRRPIPPAALSSAILRSPPSSADEEDADQVANALLELQTLRTQVREMNERLGKDIDRLAAPGNDGA